MKVALLHPGEMGVSVGAALLSCGHEVHYLPQRRSLETLERACGAGFTACASLADLVGRVDMIVAVCPPHGALTLAADVMAAGFNGLFVDANAVSPATARRLHERVGGNFVDGGIIGPPAVTPGSTRLYLAGERAAEVVDCFGTSVLDARLMTGEPGAASALKMCYAAYTKGTSALLLAVRALAAAEGVDSALLAEWDISQRDLATRSAGAARGTARKAWRFVGEMEEIANTFTAQALPAGFHEAAGEIYRRMSDLQDSAEPTLEDVLTALNRESRP